VEQLTCYVSFLVLVHSHLTDARDVMAGSDGRYHLNHSLYDTSKKKES